MKVLLIIIGCGINGVAGGAAYDLGGMTAVYLIWLTMLGCFLAWGLAPNWGR